MIYPSKGQLKRVDVVTIRQLLLDNIDKMKREEQEVLLHALERCHNRADYWFLIQYLDAPHIWKMPMVSIDTFINDKHYIGNVTKCGEGFYPIIRQSLRDIMQGGYNEAVMLCGLGAGKSYSASIIATYTAHHLLCLRNPHTFYKLNRDKPIGIMNMGLTATQALKVVFESIKTFVSSSDFFMQFKPKIGSSGIIKFDREGLELVSGNSKVTTQLGLNLICAILDEAAFYYDDGNSSGNSANNEKTSVARALYEGLQGRIKSRFKEQGLNIMISSPRTVGDFIMQKLSMSREVDEDGNRKYNIYGIQFPTWKSKSADFYDDVGTFFFNTRTNMIEEDDLSDPMYIGMVNYLKDDGFDYGKYIWEIPNTFKQEFVSNPSKSKRDFGSMPTEAIDGFLIPERVRKAFNMEREDVVRGNGKYEFPERPLPTKYYIHIDIGLNKGGKGDFTGFVMGHCEGWEMDDSSREKRMKIKIDLIERIGVKKGEQEVSIADIRERIYTLKEMGFRIALVTIDGFQSKDMFQILRKKGITAEYLSVDRTMDAYNELREAIYEERIDMYFNEHLNRELCQVEEVVIGSHIKVDHPSTGCFTGDTRVALANGTCPTFEELVNMEGPFYVYSIGESGLEIVEAVKPRVTKYTSELVEVLLDNYQVIRCTPEHLFMTLGKDWVQAQNLTSDISIMSYPNNEVSHRIISMKRVFLETPVPVYDISVPGNENFALASGVFVHNSKDLSDALAGCVHNITKNSQYSSMNVISAPNVEVDKDTRKVAEEKHAEKMNDMKQRILDKQNEIAQRIITRQL